METSPRQQVYYSESLSFEWSETTGVLYVRWNIGSNERPSSMVNDNLLAVIEQCRRFRPRFLISDHRNYLYSSFEPEVFRVFSATFFPQLVESGVQGVAFIQSDSLHVMNFLDRLVETFNTEEGATIVNFRFFECEEAALNWLLSLPVVHS